MSDPLGSFLPRAALLAGVLPLGTPLKPLSPVSIPPETLRRRLAERQASIETLVVDYTVTADRPSPLEGRHRLSYRQGLYHLRHDVAAEGITRITLATAGEVLTAAVRDGFVESVQARPRGRQDPKTSLDTFLPLPEDEPMAPRNHQIVLGDRCLGVLQEGRCYWISPSYELTRAVETFVSPGILREKVTFQEFRVLSPEIALPYQILATEVTRFGRMVAQRSLRVQGATLNEPLPDDLFSTQAFPREGETLALP